MRLTNKDMEKITKKSFEVHSRAQTPLPYWPFLNTRIPSSDLGDFC